MENLLHNYMLTTMMDGSNLLNFCFTTDDEKKERYAKDVIVSS